MHIFNFSSIPINSLYGRLLRLPLKLIPKEMVMPILQGRLKGRHWITGSANHGCWLGSYEPEWQEVFAKEIRPGATVYDVGANVGFHTLLIADIVGPNGRIFSFEPFPENINYLERHVKINKLNNVEIVGKAVLDRVGDVSFQVGKTLATGKISADGVLQVPGTDLDSFVYSDGKPAPEYIKIDVEGAEGEVLEGADKIIKETQPTIFLETHGKEIHRRCIEILQRHRYKLLPLGNPDVNHCKQLIALPSKRNQPPRT
jgi:FkbM family methyltransferase